MKSINLKPLRVAMTLTVLICAGLWFYTQWDLKRFEESLPKTQAVEIPAKAPPAEQARRQQVVTDTPETTRRHIPRFESDTERAADKKSEIAESATLDETQTSEDVSHAWLSAEYHEDTEWDSLTSGDATDGTEELPYDLEVVKAGFDDYNAFLGTDPKYAYQRLDDALREQYGDDPDVDILVEHTRRSNKGTTTLDSIIENLEAQLRLLVKNNYPGQQELQDALAFYDETKQLALELGSEIKITSHAIIDTSRD